ncbi:MAG: ABC transporter permease, partial [Pseudomonadota bacterium]
MMLYLAALVAVGFVLGWMFRFAGRHATRNAAYFRDMPMGVAFGFALGALLTGLGAWFYFGDFGTRNTFFRWAVQGLIVFFLAGYLFRFLGRVIGTAGSRKLFRRMPVTASFGLLIILLYAIL